MAVTTRMRAVALVRRFNPAGILRAGRSALRKAQQLGFGFGPQTGFGFGTQRDVRAPGAHGSTKWWRDAHGHVHYGERPAQTSPTPAPAPEPDKLTVEEAERLGYAAHARGLRAVPALDAEFRRRLEGAGNGTMPLLEAWSRGWHRRNVTESWTAAPEPAATPAATPRELPTGPWAQLEDAYFDAQVKRDLQSAIATIRYNEAELAKLGPKSQQRVLIEGHIAYWQKQQKEIETDPTAYRERRIPSWRVRYAKLVKEAISKGKPVPPEVIAQHSEFKKAQDARARYNKGRHTSFGNRSVAVDDRMQAARGYKIKRQDGKAMTDAQRDAIAKGVDEVEEVLGPLKDILQAEDLTIAHTSGKHPFLSDAGGMYHSGDVTVTMGVDDVLGRPIPSLAHELGHFIDHVAGSRLGKRISTWRKRKMHTTDALSENDRYERSPEANLTRDAGDTINKTREVRTALKKKYSETEDQEERAEIERVRVQLGPYWHEPAEIWARLLEQYVATKRGVGGEATMTPERYARTPGYWTAEDFGKLMPQVESALARCLGACRLPKAQRPEPVATRKAQLEAAIFLLDDEDLPALADDDRRRPPLVDLRARLLTELADVDRTLKARALHARRRAGDLEVSIENRADSIRRWYDPHAQREGETRMQGAHYGYIRGTIGLDGDHVDCFLKVGVRRDAFQALPVFVIETRKPPDFDELDEQKVMLGWSTADEARAAFLSHYDNERFIGQIDQMSWDEFREHVRATREGGVRLIRGTPVAMKARLALRHPVNAQANAKANPNAQANAQANAKANTQNSGTTPAPPSHDEVGAHVDQLRPALTTLVGQLGTLFPGVPVAGRLRETAAVAERGLEEAEDVAGVRLVVDNAADETLAAKRIGRSLETKASDDFVRRPSGGYRGVHITADVDGQSVEVQVRTAGQTAWADAAHDVAVKLHGQQVPPAVRQYLTALGEYVAQRDTGKDPGMAPECPPEAKAVCGDLAAVLADGGTKPGAGKSPANAGETPANARETPASADGLAVVTLLAVRDLEAGKPVVLRPITDDEDTGFAAAVATARRQYPSPKFEVVVGIARDLETFTTVYPRFARAAGRRPATPAAKPASAPALKTRVRLVLGRTTGGR